MRTAIASAQALVAVALTCSLVTALLAVLNAVAVLAN